MTAIQVMPNINPELQERAKKNLQLALNGRTEDMPLLLKSTAHGFLKPDSLGLFAGGKLFDLPLADPTGLQAKIISVAFEKPQSVAFLYITGGAPNSQVTFLNHSHPGGEYTIQLTGRTIETEVCVEPGHFRRENQDSIHQPKGQLDSNGVYLALVWWGQGTQPIEQR